ncbi:AraC family transcriptional regulator [Algibacillus agarilyticus]|uniref:AraC family transcriptional regulator n=1 Tax=Algibacillus agarilyticus TaxID=2234133 RepID=UPI000DD0D20F|nr:AraC family transcriptional regulator [Algibacillus agarilyticus]
MSASQVEIIEIGAACCEHFFSDDEFPAFKQWQIHIAGVSQLQGLYHIARRFPKHHMLVYTVSGRGLWQKQTDNLSVFNSGDCLLIPANTDFEYQADPVKGWETVWFILPQDTYWKNFPSAITLQSHCTTGHKWQQLLMLLQDEKYKKDQLSEQMCQLYSQQLFILLTRHLQSIDPSTAQSLDRIQQLFNAVENAPHLNWSIDTLCAHSHYSRAHLFRLTKQLFNCSPLQKVTKIRMHKASVLLKTTNLSIQQLAQLVGYDDPFNFSTRFKQSMQVSPRQYRLAH